MDWSMWMTVAAIGGGVSLLRLLTQWLSAERGPTREPRGPRKLGAAVGIAEAQGFQPWIQAGQAVPGTWRRFVMCAPSEDGLLLVPLDVDTAPERSRFQVVIGPVERAQPFVLELELRVGAAGDVRSVARDKRRQAELPSRIEGTRPGQVLLPTQTLG